MLSFRTPLLLATVALLTSCAKDNEPVPAPVYLLDQRWELTELQGQAPPAQPGSTVPDLVLNSVGSTNSGRAFCNQYGGKYTLTAGSPQLSFATQGSTYATCADQDAETRYLRLLPTVARYVISNRHLSLYDAQHAEPLLVFKAAE
jgi:heat shock protein HslJ